MCSVAYAITVVFLYSAQVDIDVVCTNGSFEKLDARGWAVDWQAVGETVEVCDDAHTGSRALRMVRTAQTKAVATGLNRHWVGQSGEQGAMIDRIKGGIDFWYKAVSADHADLNVTAIPMTVEPI